MNRNETLIHILAFILIGALSAVLYMVFTDSRPGLSAMDAPLEKGFRTIISLKQQGILMNPGFRQFLRVTAAMKTVLQILLQQ